MSSVVLSVNCRVTLPSYRKISESFPSWPCHTTLDPEISSPVFTLSCGTASLLNCRVVLPSYRKMWQSPPCHATFEPETLDVCAWSI